MRAQRDAHSDAHSGLMSRARSPWLGLFFLLLSVVAFGGSDITAKAMIGRLPSAELAWMRLAFLFVIASVLAARSGPGVLRPKHPWLQIVRGCCVALSSAIMILALKFIPLSVAAAVNFTAPAILTTMSVLLLGERAGPRRWVAIFVGLFGVVVIVRPGGEALQLAALIPLASAFTWATALLITRFMGGRERTDTTLFWSAASGLFLLSAMLPFGAMMPERREFWLGLLMGFCSASGQVLILHAYRLAPASMLAPFRYLQVVAAMAGDYFIFGAIPDATGFIGIAIIIGAGLYSGYADRHEGKQAG